MAAVVERRLPAEPGTTAWGHRPALERPPVPRHGQPSCGRGTGWKGHLAPGPEAERRCWAGRAGIGESKTKPGLHEYENYERRLVTCEIQRSRSATAPSVPTIAA